jgi:dTDP-4-amino-4,6-dideoxy-D-galactose acyltransferase
MASNLEPCTLLDWDTNFFGFPIARVNGSQLNSTISENILRWCAENNIRCLYFLADADHPQTVRLAELHGFYLTDIRMELERRLEGISLPNETATGIRLAVGEDLPALLAIAGSAYQDSRFYHDGHFSGRQCDQLYRAWIENSLNGFAQVVLVLGNPGNPMGFITCNTSENSIGSISLLGVSSTSRGQGVGQKLIDASLAWFKKIGMLSVEVVTQGRNIAAQRLYQRNGFITKEMKLWYHKWFE